MLLRSDSAPEPPRNVNLSCGASDPALLIGCWLKRFGTAHHSFAGEVPRICGFITSRRHQLPPIAPRRSMLCVVEQPDCVLADLKRAALLIY
jgi:hypothetical protein